MAAGGARRQGRPRTRPEEGASPPTTSHRRANPWSLRSRSGACGAARSGDLRPRCRGRGGEQGGFFPRQNVPGRPACLGTFAPLTAKPATTRLCLAENSPLGPPGSPHWAKAEGRPTVSCGEASPHLRTSTTFTVLWPQGGRMETFTNNVVGICRTGPDLRSRSAAGSFCPLVLTSSL